MQAGHTASVIPDGVIKVYFFNVQIGDLDERAILPRMSSYRVLQHDYMRKQVINPDENEAPTIFANEQSRVTVATHEIKIMQQTDQHFVPFTCCLFETIQSLLQLPQSPTVVTQLTRLSNRHNIIQLAILECTLYIKMHCLQILACTNHQ